MLWNQKWDRPVHTLMTVENWIAWLEKQPADRAYRWDRRWECAMALYLIDAGVDIDNCRCPSYIEMPGYFSIAAERPHTCGAALVRAKHYLAAQSR